MSFQKISQEFYMCLTGHNRKTDITVMLKIDIYILTLCQLNGVLTLGLSLACLGYTLVSKDF